MLLKSKVILAPMAGVTDKPFRQMVRMFGNQLLHTEMISATSLCYGSKETYRMMDIKDEKAPVAIQLVGNNPSEMAKAAQIAEQMGAIQIDINMGCPVKKLISNISGSALMKEPYLAYQIVNTVKKSVHIPVTVKTRLGWDMEHINIIDFAQNLEEAGADALTIHARTKEQGYSGFADWSWIKKVKERISIPVIANGDIKDKESTQQCLDLTGADGVMIGRAAMGRPWILSQIEGNLSSFELREVVLEHFNRLMSYYGHKGLFIARKHLSWYATGKSFVANFRRQVYSETNEDKVRELIQSYFKEEAV